MESQADKIAAVLEEREIEKVLLRYCRAIDRVDVELLRTIFEPDAWLEYSMYQGPAKDFCTLVPDFVKDLGLTQHRLSNVLVSLNGDTAECESYLVAHHADVPMEGGLFDIRVGVRYADHFGKRDGQWRITARKVIYDWNQTVPAGSGWAPPLFANEIILGKRGRNDESYFGGEGTY